MKQQRVTKLIGSKVYLCPLMKKDIGLFQKWMSDLEVASKIGEVATQVMTSESQIAWFEKQAKLKNHILLSIVAKKNLKTIGNITLKDIHQTDRRANMGILIGDKNYWSKGYGREAIVLLLDFGFNVLNLHSVAIGAYSYNVRAMRAYNAIGFKEVGRLREAHFWGGRYYDIIKMDILAQEFKDSKIKDLILESQQS